MTVPRHQITWSRLIEKRLAARKCQLRPSSLRIEGIILEHEVRWLTEKGVTPGSKTTEDHEAYLSFRIDQGRAGCTRRRETFAMRGLLAFAKERKLLKENVLEGFKLPKVDEAHVYVPSGLELAQVLDHLRHRSNPKRNRQLIYKDKSELRYHELRNRALIIVLVDSLARIGEILRLEMPQVDLVRQQITLLDTKTYTSRTVPITAETVDAINEYLRVRPEGKTAHLFLTEYATPIQVNSFSQTFRRLVQGAGIGKNITLHSIRHFSITEMARKDLFAAMQKAGQRDLKVTQGYLKRDPEYVRQVSEQAATLKSVLDQQKSSRKRQV